MPNPYQASLYPKAQLGMIIQEHASKNKQGISTYIMKTLLEHFRDEFIEKWSKEEYDAYHYLLSATLDEQMKVKEEKKREKARKEREKNERQRKALELKEKELAIREMNIGTRINEKKIRAKHKGLVQILKSTKYRRNKEERDRREQAEKELKELREKYPFLYE